MKYLLPAVVMVVSLTAMSPIKAQTDTVLNVLNQTGGQVDTLGVGGNRSVPEIVGRVINFFLSFLGVVALVLIIYGGFLWMTARGDTEQVKKARDLLVQAVIGLIIILSAYALANFVISNIANVVSS